MKIEVNENKYWEEGSHNPRWIAEFNGKVHSGDTVAQAVEGVVNMQVVHTHTQD